MTRESKEHPEEDLLVRALRELPRRRASSRFHGHIHEKARAAFLASERETPSFSLGVLAFRAAIPVGLVGVVAVYLTWAITFAAALMQ